MENVVPQDRKTGNCRATGISVWQYDTQVWQSPRNSQKISMAGMQLSLFLNSLKPSFAGWGCLGSGSCRWSWCIPDLSAKYICFTVPLCWKLITSMAVGVNMHLSLLRKFQRLSINLWGVYLVHTLNFLMNYQSGSAWFSCRWQTCWANS